MGCTYYGCDHTDCRRYNARLGFTLRPVFERIQEGDTVALAIASLFADGCTFTSELTGVSLLDLCEQFYTAQDYGRVVWVDDEGQDVIEYCQLGDPDAMRRFVFDDDSAIVMAGDAWDVEGVAPFSWAGV